MDREDVPNRNPGTGDEESLDIEIRLLLEAMWMKYGYDFRDYARAHIRRRIRHRMQVARLNTVSEMQYKLLYDTAFFQEILMDFSINVTEIFRDPSFYLAVRQQVAPQLRTWPFRRVWHAGCSTGEEVYSMSILFKEEGLYERTQFYATDFNEAAIRKARQGLYGIDLMKEYTLNYQQAGGRQSFSDYYTARYDSVIFDKSLKSQITFADHNLVTDSVFGEMHMIVCRNVLIYFNRELRERVLRLFFDSLVTGGFLCLGGKESLLFSEWTERFEEVVPEERIYRKRW